MRKSQKQENQSPIRIQIKETVRYTHKFSVLQIVLGKEFRGCRLVMAARNKVCHKILLGANLSEHRGELLGTDNVQKLSQQVLHPRILWLFLVQCLHNSIVVAE